MNTIHHIKIKRFQAGRLLGFAEIGLNICLNEQIFENGFTVRNIKLLTGGHVQFPQAWNSKLAAWEGDVAHPNNPSLRILLEREIWKAYNN